MQTQNTLAAIEKFVNVQLLVLGMLQLIAKDWITQLIRQKQKSRKNKGIDKKAA